MSGIERGLNETLSNGEDVYLSVDLRLQYLVTEELAKAINKFNADGGVSIIFLRLTCPNATPSIKLAAFSMSSDFRHSGRDDDEFQ